MSAFFLTTPIYYVNSYPHLGHAYTTIAADAVTRFHHMMGKDAIFITGTDEHGDKITQAAEKAGENVENFTTVMSNEFRALWPKLDTEPHAFIRTSDERHKKHVQDFLQKVYDAGDIYFGDYGGHYCYGCERFYTEKELENGLCPQHLVKPEYISEKNYFFRMSRYQDWLKEYILEHPDFVRPERYRSEVLALLDSGVLDDLCISRPKTRLTWGIELPFDTEYVCYVWFDALLSYISAIGGIGSEEYERYWPHAQHLVAKDILKPHAVFWPTMLKAGGVPLFKHLNVHGYWLARETKMSKSIGNVIGPVAMTEKYGIDAFRYFLLRDMHFGNDANFSEDALAARFNSDLANDLGNLFSRVLTMTAKYCEGVIPSPAQDTDMESDLKNLASDSLAAFQAQFGEFRFSQALESLWELIRALNKYVDAAAPWALAKKGEYDRLGTVLYTLLECMRKVALHVWPIMPEKSEQMWQQLGITLSPADAPLHEEVDSFGMLAAGLTVASASNLFPRLELEEKPQPAGGAGKKPASGKKAAQVESVQAASEKKADPAAQAAQGASGKFIEPAQEIASAGSTASDPSAQGASGLIDFADFQKPDLRIGTVVACEAHPNADKLLKVMVDLGEDRPRQILAGMAAYFAPQDMIGKQVTVVTNLAPRKMRGLESQGMILAVKTENDGLELLVPAGAVPPGSKVS